MTIKIVEVLRRSDQGMTRPFICRLLDQKVIGKKFQNTRVGDSEFTVLFPFVEMSGEQPLKVIKPLNLTQNDSTKILEHCGKWEFRMRELKKRDVFPEKVLFAVDGPTQNGSRIQAYQESLQILNDTGVTVLDYQNQRGILDFALNG